MKAEAQPALWFENPTDFENSKNILNGLPQSTRQALGRFGPGAQPAVTWEVAR